jgi:Flp pilus assembly protein TadD/predicted SAM-dependent methyltransferase
VATIADTLAQAKAAHFAGQLADAVQLYQQVLAADSANAEAHYLLGAACHGLGRPNEALASLAQAIRLQPNHVEAHHHLGAVLAQEGDLEQAILSFQQALRLRPGSAEISANLRHVTAAKDNYQGNELVAQGKLAEAAACYRRALELNPDFAEAHNGLGAVFEKQKIFAEAAACCRRALALKPDFAEAHYNLGAIWGAQGRPVEAVACYRRALELRPGFAEASNNLGILLAQERIAPESQELHAKSKVPGLKRILSYAAQRFLTPGERAALRSFLTERTIAAYHRRGLRQIRRDGLSRPAKLNLGCGPSRKDGFLNVDLFPGGDMTLDIRRGLPFDSDCCDLIFSEHCFEHFDYPEAITQLFRECLRVLSRGGALRFSVPDTEWPLTDYRDGPNAPYFKACEKYGWHPADCTTRLEHINYHFRQGTEHRYAYDFETAEKVLETAGFVGIQQSAFDPSLDSEHRKVGSLFVVARKPA